MTSGQLWSTFSIPFLILLPFGDIGEDFVSALFEQLVVFGNQEPGEQNLLLWWQHGAAVVVAPLGVPVVELAGYIQDLCDKTLSPTTCISFIHKYNLRELLQLKVHRHRLNRKVRGFLQTAEFKS